MTFKNFNNFFLANGLKRKNNKLKIIQMRTSELIALYKQEVNPVRLGWITLPQPASSDNSELTN